MKREDNAPRKRAVDQGTRPPRPGTLQTKEDRRRRNHERRKKVKRDLPWALHAAWTALGVFGILVVISYGGNPSPGSRPLAQSAPAQTYEALAVPAGTPTDGPTFGVLRSDYVQALLDDGLFAWDSTYPAYVVGRSATPTMLPMTIQVHGLPSVTHVVIRTSELTTAELQPLIATLDPAFDSPSQSQIADLEAVLRNDAGALVSTEKLTVSAGTSPDRPTSGWITIRPST